ncbi:MAG TPA: AraC family transcriptional regulator [Vicinamibacterales bacterium]|nr:AraC family transcriptional regulator [Vicinamibacterales bacterium]
MRILAGQYCGTQVVKRHMAGLHIVESAYEPNQSVPWHVHQWPYFTFVLRGGYTEHCLGQTWDIAEGDVVLHEAGEAHSDRMHDGETYLLNLEFTQSWLDRIDGCGARLDTRFRSSGGPFLQLGHRLHRELWRDDRVSALCIEGLALQLIAETAQIKRRPAGRGRWWKKAIDYLRANFKESPTLHDVAEAAGVHPVHLAHEFRRKQGLTVGDYIRKLRVEWACQELVRSDKTIVEIAVKAGFSDHSHMTRVFRRETGLTPSEFRKTRLRA